MKTTQSRKVLLFLFITLFVVFSYTFLHEGGHAVAGILSGGRLTAFSLNFFDLSAHVSLDGNFNLPQILLINLAGVSLPLLVWLILMLAVPRQANLAIESLKVVATLITLNTLLAWIVLPLLFLAGKAPADDVTSFLRNSDLNPWLVSLLALLIYIAGWLLFTQKIVGVRSELAFFQKTDQESVTPAVWKSILSMLALLVLFGLTGFAANGFRLTTQKIGSYLPPPVTAW